MSTDRRDDYVLGTHDEEIARLEVQHRVWRPYVRHAWERAEVGAGDIVIDIGAGPGWATLDLAEIVGAKGRVIALERARRYVDTITRAAEARGHTNVDAREIDLDADPWPDVIADRAFCRWVIAFLQQPQRAVENIASHLRPGGTFISYEYANYATWRLLPGSAAFDEFVRHVVAAWRADGGEPDIALALPSWLEAAEFEVTSVRPLAHVALPGDPMWTWAEAFVHVGLERLVELERIPRESAAEILLDFERRRNTPGTRMLTPLVLEIIAIKR